ncbi:glycosyltransferase family 4 protein [Dyella sp.]|uniref:glycosyltransferase family 4 protein n=1 Tax=Dyella sp. TaxID=1869338 RepID=UPI002ED1DACE
MTEQASQRARLRLLVLTSTYPRWPGDPEPGFVHELCKRLASRMDVTVIGPHAAGAAVHDAMDGVTVHRYRYAPARLETLVNHGGILGNLRRSRWKWMLMPWFLLGQYRALHRYMDTYRPDVVHAHWLLPQGFVAAAARLPIPLLVTSHGADLFGLRGRLFQRMRGWVTRRMTMLTVVSEAMRERLLAEQPHACVQVMPMGVDTRSRFRPTDVSRDHDELLFVGRLVEKKGLRHLLDALPAVVQAHPGVFLTIAGFGPEQAALENQASTLGIQDRVRFVGALAQDALPALYQRAALFVAPFVQAADGDQEGLGLVVAEAMACGCPVVAGDVPATADLVAAGAGVRVHASEPALLAHAINDLLADDAARKRMAANALAYVEARFSWDHVAEGYAQLIEQLALGAHA